MNILITGCEGFIGNSLVGKLKESNNLVVGIGRKENFKKNAILKNKPDVFIRGDIRDYNLLRETISKYNIEEVYHFAAQPIVSICSNDPVTAYEINTLGAVTLLEACRNSGQNIKSIIIFTSDKAFGHAPIPYTEETPLDPKHIYETSKACQQLIALSFFHN